MADAMYSVTLTGKVQAGKDAPAVWQRVEHLLKLDPDAFRQRVLARVPITLQAADAAVAERQYAAVLACGADAELLAEGGDEPRMWLYIDEATHGPVSHAYAKAALARGDLDPALRVCELGEQAWVPLRDLFAPQAPVPASRRGGEAVQAKPDAAAPAPAPRAGMLPGWGIAGVVIAAALAIVAVFIVLALRATSG